MKVLGLIPITVLLLSCSTLSDSNSRKVASKYIFRVFKEEVEKIEQDLQVEPKHRSQFLIHKNNSGVIHRTDNVVVVLHGLSLSPQWMQQIAETFYDRGHNVINLRLAKHFETPRKNLDNVRYQDWLKQVDDLLPYLNSLGREAVFVGHSTGAVMAMYGSVNSSIPTKQLILLSPALKLTLSLKASTAIARFLGISGAFTDKIRKTLTIDPKKYDSTFAEVQVRNLSESVTKDTLGYNSRSKTFGSSRMDHLMHETPTLVIDTEGDLIVNVYNNKMFFSHLRKTQYQRISQEDYVAHNKIMFLKKRPKRDTLTYQILNDFLSQHSPD